MKMHLSADEINRDATELIRRVLQKFDRGLLRRLSGKRSDLLSEGYSQLIVSKAEEFALRERLYSAASAVFVWLGPATLNLPRWARPTEVVFILWLGYLIYQYRRCKLSNADNKLVWEELSVKARSEPEPRAFLWRIDAFLRGRK